MHAREVWCLHYLQIVFDDSVLAKKKRVGVRVVVEKAELTRHLHRNGVLMEVTRSTIWRRDFADIVVACNNGHVGIFSMDGIYEE